jgi:hypothetical protein
MRVKTPIKVFSPPTKVQDGLTVNSPTITAERTTVRERLSWRDCVRVNDLTTVTVSARGKETGGPGGTLLWVGLATGDRVAAFTGVKVQERLKTKVAIPPRTAKCGGQKMPQMAETDRGELKRIRTVE